MAIRHTGGGGMIWLHLENRSSPREMDTPTLVFNPDPRQNYSLTGAENGLRFRLFAGPGRPSNSGAEK